jgi:sulfate permease, SulP family
VVMLVTFFLAVAVSLSLAVEVGVVLALVLFLKRVSETSSIRPVQDLLDGDSDKEASISFRNDQTAEAIRSFLRDLEIYEITGPSFSGLRIFCRMCWINLRGLRWFSSCACAGFLRWMLLG